MTAMKKFYILSALAALLAFTACSKESDQDPEVNTGKTVNLTFTSKRPQLKSDTKTAWDAATTSIVWSSGDKIRVGYTLDGNWMGQTGAGTAKFYASDTVKINESNSSIGTFSVPDTFTDPSSSGAYQFYAVYPSAILSSTEVASPESASITLPATQDLVSGSFDSSADLLVGKSSAMTLSGLPNAPISLSWTRLVAHADLTFSNLAFDGAEIVNKITLTFNEDAKVAGSVSVNIPEGTAGTGSTNVLELSSTTGIESSSSSFEAWACVLPVTFTSLDVEIKTDKATYTRSITGISKTFKQNSRNKLTIKMSSATRTAQTAYDWVVTDLSAITSSDVFVIVGNNGSTYAMSNKNGTSSAPAAVAVTVTGSSTKKLSAAPSEAIQWTLSKDESNYTFYPYGSTEKWLYCTSSNDGVRVGTNDNKVFTLDESGYLKNTATFRYVGIYSSHDWRCYTSSTTNNIAGQAFAFYVKTTPKEDADLSYETTSYEVEAGGTFTSPTLTNPNNLTVTYSSSNTDLATVDATTGKVTIGSNPGTVTITATFAGNETYHPGTASYTIKITDPNANDGSLEHPYTASEAAALALGGDTGSYYISGIVTKIQNQYSASYGTANFWLDENGESQTVFEGYKIKYFGNVNWVDGNAEIAVNDDVIIYGTLTVYNTTTPETSSGYLVSLNGKTKGLTPGTLTATPDNDNKKITVTWAAATGTESTISYEVTCGTQTYNATAAGSHTFTMADYGTYNVSVAASADDAVSGVAKTTATISDPSATTKVYLKYSGDLTEGDYIIYYNGKALKNTVSSNRLGYAEVTPSGENITDPDASIVWHIAPSGDYWTIYNAEVEKYAAGNGTKNQGALIASATDDGANLWTASGSGTYEFVNKKNAANNVNANLRNNGTYGFACYGTGTGGALSLYKLD